MTGRGLPVLVALALVPITVPAAADDTHCKPLLDLAQAPARARQ